MYRQEEKFGQRTIISLVYASSEDDARPAAALRDQTRVSCGWQSAKHCTFPQELVFRFEGSVSLGCVRLLAHESKISSCVDVSIAEASPEEIQQGICGPFESAEFVRLGHVRFTTNEASNFAARELKTVGIQRQCCYLKLTFHRPHVNAYNLFHQVGLVALTAHGQITRNLNFSETGNITPVVVGENADSPLDEMMPLTIEESNAASYDAAKGTAHNIENLKVLKSRAIAEEDYDLAEKLRQQISSLEASKPEIEKLEAEKRKAVLAEDYVRAKDLKKQIDALRYTESSENGSSSIPMLRNSQANKNSASANHPVSAQLASAHPKPPPATSQLPSLRQRGTPHTGPSQHDEVAVGGKGYYDLNEDASPFDSPPGTHGGNSGSVAKEDKELSTSGGGQPWEQQLNDAISGLITDKSVPVALSGEAAAGGKGMEKDLGIYCTACLLAKRGQLREAAVRGAVSKKGYRAVSSHTATGVETLLGYMTEKGRGVSDPFPGVVFASCEALHKMVGGSLDGEHVPSAAQLAPLVTKIIPELVSRLGDANSRVRENVEGAIAAIARSSIGPDRIIALLMVDPDKEAKKAASYRAHLSRVNLLYAFVALYGVQHTSDSPHALQTLELLSQVVFPSLQHANSEVREAAAKLFALLVEVDGSVARRRLSELKPAQQAMVEGQVREQAAAQRGSPLSPSRGQRNTNGQSDLETKTQSVGRQPALPAAGEDDLDGDDEETENETSANDREVISAANRTPEFVDAHTCQFCHRFDVLPKEFNLDVHYVRRCPMLTPCPLCDQVTEICSLQQHLLTECDGRSRVRECPRCHEAILSQFFKRHMAAQNCIESVDSFCVCPLCHGRFKTGMENWRRHLATPPGCPNNPRNYDGSGAILDKEKDGNGANGEG